MSSDDKRCGCDRENEKAIRVEVDDVDGDVDGDLVELPLVHERQRLQLCAVHAVNNLLQLSPDHGDDNDEGDSDSSTRGYRIPIVFGSSHNAGAGGVSDRPKYSYFRRSKFQMKPATKSELDEIADKMTSAEHRLLSSDPLAELGVPRSSSSGGSEDGDECGGRGFRLCKSRSTENAGGGTQKGADDVGNGEGRSDDGVDASIGSCSGGGSSSGAGPRTESDSASDPQPSPAASTSDPRPTLYQKITSNHRTLYLGNYSFEAMEIALRNRGVELSWYRVPDAGMTGLCDVEGEGESGVGVLEQKQTVVAGFIVNAPDRESWYLRPLTLIQYVPLVGGFFAAGRHWYAVTRLRAVRQRNGVRDVAGCGTDICAEGDATPWYVVDSDEYEAMPLQSEEELASYLREVQDRGGQLFRATIAEVEAVKPAQDAGGDR